MNSIYFHVLCIKYSQTQKYHILRVTQLFALPSLLLPCLICVTACEKIDRNLTQLSETKYFYLSYEVFALYGYN